MTEPIKAMDIFKQLPRNNCGECGVATCLAFCTRVIQGSSELTDCPYAPESLGSRVAAAVVSRIEDAASERAEFVAGLRQRMRGLDLAEAAERVGGWMKGDRLAIHCLGKIFELDREGGLHSDCHINLWIHGPLLSLVLDGKGLDVTGQWVPFDELAGAVDWLRFWEHRVQRPLGRLADEDPDLFFDVLSLFGKQPARSDELSGSSDDAVVLHPFPRVPMMFCYFRPEGGFESKLAIRFDRCCGDNLDAGSVFRLGSAFVEMFGKIMIRHGHDGQ
jgi:hypothetical protein